MIAANVVINYFSLILHSALGGDSINTSTSAEDSDALTHSDKVVQLAAEESIVLLKNDDDFLPLNDLTKVNLFGYGSTDAVVQYPFGYGLSYTQFNWEFTSVPSVLSDENNVVKVKVTNVGAVLSGYNHAMLTTVLREEWGFRDSVITDRFTGSGYMSKHINGIIAGNDLWLCGSTGSASAPIDFNNPAQAYAARRSAKNILYTFVVTNLSSDEIAVNAAPHSALLDGLWIGLNVLLGAGIIVCVIFVILPIDKAKKPAEGGEEKVES